MEDALVLNFARIRDKRVSVGVVTLSFVALGVLFALLSKTSRSQTELGPERRKLVSAHIGLAHIREAKGNFYILEIRTAWCDWRVPVSGVLGIHPRVHSTWRTPGTRSSFLLSDFRAVLIKDRGFLLFCLQLSYNLGTIPAGFTDSALSSSRRLPVPKIVLRMYVLSSLPEGKLHGSKKSVLRRLRPGAYCTATT